MASRFRADSERRGGRRRWLAAATAALVAGATAFALTPSAALAAPTPNYTPGKDIATFTLTGVTDTNCAISVGGGEIWIKPGDSIEFRTALADAVIANKDLHQSLQGLLDGVLSSSLGKLSGVSLTDVKLADLGVSVTIDKGTKGAQSFRLDGDHTTLTFPGAKYDKLGSGKHTLDWSVTSISLLPVLSGTSGLISGLTSEIAGKKGLLGSVTGQVRDLTEQLNSLTGGLLGALGVDKLIRKLTGQIDKLNDQIDSLNKQIASLTSQLHAATGLIDKLLRTPAAVSLATLHTKLTWKGTIHVTKDAASCKLLSVKLPSVDLGGLVGNGSTPPPADGDSPASPPSDTPSSNGGPGYTTPGQTVPDRVVPKGGGDAADGTYGAGGGGFGNARSDSGGGLVFGPAGADGGQRNGTVPNGAAPSQHSSGAPDGEHQSTVNLAANEPPVTHMPVLLAILAILALSLVTATYARLYLLRRNG